MAKLITLLYILLNPLMANSESIAMCVVNQSTNSGTVTSVTDKSHLNEDNYLSFSLSCTSGTASYGQLEIHVPRGNLSNEALKDIKKLLLLSYATKNRIQFSAIPTGQYSETGTLDVSKPLTLK